MFIRELSLNIDRLYNEIQEFSVGVLAATPKYLQKFKTNLLKGIEYYQELADQFVEEQRRLFLDDLKRLEEKVNAISLEIAE
jgi:hypothetical protein